MSLIIENWQIISGAIAAIFAFFGGLKLKKIEVQRQGATALGSMQIAYNEFVVDQKERYKELKEELSYVRERVKQVEAESMELRLEVREWKSKYLKLKKEFDAYRKRNK